MEKATYFIAFTWISELKGISFGNSVIEEFPLKWLKEMQEHHSPGKGIKLLWWKQLTDKDEIKAAKGIGMTAV
jgi:hypothetical protein